MASFDDIIARLRRRHVLTIANVEEYAPHVHYREGYYVLDGEHAAGLFSKFLREATKGGRPVTDELIDLAMEAAGFEEVSHLRSLTSDLAPPIPPNKTEREEGRIPGPRYRHPGHWADRSSHLANGYKAYVNGRTTTPNIPNASSGPKSRPPAAVGATK